MKRLLLGIIAVTLLCTTAFCTEPKLFDEQYDALELDALEKSKPESAAEIELTEELTLDSGLAVLWEKLRDGFGALFRRGLKCVSMIVAISMLCAAVCAMGAAGESPQVKSCVSLVGALAVTAAAAGSITSVFAMGREAIDSMNVFSKSLLPTLAAACAASGRPTAAVVRSAATVLFSDILISIINTVLLPLVYVNIAAATADAAAPNETLKKISAMICKITAGTLKILLGAFVSYVTVTGIVSGNVDRVGLATARFAISGAVPVVGGIISEAAETVIAGAALIKNVIGVFGMLSILSICLTPFCALAINCFLFKCAAAVASPVIDSKISNLTDSIGTSFGLVLGMTGACAAVMLISVIVSMYAVGVA